MVAWTCGRAEIVVVGDVKYGSVGCSSVDTECPLSTRRGQERQLAYRVAELMLRRQTAGKKNAGPSPEVAKVLSGKRWLSPENHFPFLSLPSMLSPLLTVSQSPFRISESFLTVKGAALFLPRGNGSSTPRISHRRNKHAGDLQQHLQAMFILLRPEDNIRLAVRLESTYQNRTRYMVVVSTNGRQDTEESIVLGMDFSSNDSSTCTMGLVLPLWSDTLIHLDGDGGFSVSTDNRVHIFKPVSVQAMWSALQSLHKACEVARSNNYYPGSLFLTWVSYYESHINSDQSSVNEWNAMQDVQSHRPDSPALFTDVPTERERTERLIKTKLREIMMQKDLENITSKEIRTELEMQMVCNLREFKEFIDNEMIVILGQMDSPTQIFDHVFLGSEWNASNLEDLQNRGKQRHNKLWRSHSDSDLSDHHEPICKSGLELNKKEITTSADQISEAKTNDNQQPMSPIYSAELEREQQLPEDANMIEEMCVKERRIHLEFTCRDLNAEQMEDKLNLNNLNGCTAGCCVDSVPPDNCHASEALMQLQHPLEIAEFPDLTVDDLEKDALKPDMNEVPELPSTGHLTRSHSENAISVKEIITEIESINQAAGPAQQKEGSANLTQTPKRNTVHDLPVEAIWASEKVEQSEGACAGHQEKEKDPLQAEQEAAPSLQPSSGKSDLEESSPGGEQQELRGSINPEPKWCPGSVRRATLEFEERLRQEQEHQHVSPVCVLPTRKNSRNDSPAAELLPRGKSEEPPLELAPEGDKAQGPGAEELLLPSGAELPVSRHLPAPMGPPALESLPAEPSPGQEGMAQERRTVVSFDGTEEPSLPSLLPKRIEIIEYTPMVKSAERPDASCEQGGLATAVPSLDENLNPSLCSEKAPACPGAPTLVNLSLPEDAVHKQDTFTVGSPSEEGGGLSVHLGAASPSPQVTSTPSASLDRSSHPYVIHLEGVTEQSTGTDDEPVTPCGIEEDAALPFRDRPQPLCTSRRLSGEDFTSQHVENMDLLDISFLCYSLPHSSSSHSVEERSNSPGLVKQRAKEIEARIRHAGLTTPSHMKRSASLAKLDCLDLSKDDLSERELASSDANPVLLTCVALGQGFRGGRLERGSESACGKHRLSSPEPTRHFVEQLRTAECIAQSKPVERPLAQYAKECGSSQQSLFSSTDPTWTSSEEGPPLLQVQVLDSLSPAQGLAVAPRQQHGRTHPLRRLKKTNDKKRTTNPLYNTM
ncbi:protein phosphatase slingshot hypothetical protein [Limosa lapponica baueri]|uniref:protein-serine/threonine phosphatase n=1 Tax=Limosa lapponica baueri TaxID=1758121 RepID=A0A2I0TTN4_LIMLA|nr:protein phosphatase slingshot hypothetical protein [Limosa lapponica baueri]